MGPVAFAGFAVGIAVILLIAVAVMLRLKRGREQRRAFVLAEEAAKAGKLDEAFKFYRDGYIVTFEGDADAVRTLDQRAMIGRVRELFIGQAEPPGLAALAAAAENDLIRNPSTRFGTRFRHVSSTTRTASSRRMRSPVRQGSSSRVVDARALLRKFVPTARPYGFYSDLTTPELIEQAVAACSKEDVRDIAELAGLHQDDDSILRYVMLELDAYGLRNIDADALFTTDDLVRMLQELAPLSRGVIAAGGAAALLDLAAQKAQLSVSVKGKVRVFEVAYRGSRIDKVELIHLLNVFLEEGGSPRRYGLFDTQGPDLETGCLEQAEWDAIERDRFLPVLKT